MAEAAIRFGKDLMEVVEGVNTDAPPVLCEAVDGRMGQAIALIMGPAETPYHFGFFFFDIRLPDQYPHEPLKVRLQTTDLGRVRLNPNLYADGKVCLSSLNTWTGESSEKWRSSYGILYILHSIQSLILNATPYHNEPGFHDDGSTLSIVQKQLDAAQDAATLAAKAKYFPDLVPAGAAEDAEMKTPGKAAEDDSEVPAPAPAPPVGSSPPTAAVAAAAAAVTTPTSPPSADAASPTPAAAAGAAAGASPANRSSPTLALAYNDKILHETFRVAVVGVVESALAGRCPAFIPQIKREFRMRYESYEAVAAKQLARGMDGQAFQQCGFESSLNRAAGTYAWGTICSRLKELKAQLDAETERWVARGQELTSRKAYAVSTIKELEERLARSDLPCSVGIEDDNVFVWHVALMLSDTLYDEGGVSVTIVFSDDPSEYPKVTFDQDVFHPNVSPSGVPAYYVPPGKEQCPVHIVEELIALLSKPPSSSSAYHVNPEAVALCHARDPADRELWKKRVRHLFRE